MSVITLKVGPLRTNCYLYYDPNSKNCLIIDPGADADKIISEIKKNQLKPTAIINTHGHWDHLLAVNDLKEEFSNLPFYLKKADLQILKNTSKDAMLYAGLKVGKLPNVDRFLDDWEEIELNQSPNSMKPLNQPGNFNLQIISTPGHTEGGVILYSPSEKFAFTGDTIFAQGYLGRTDLEGGDSKKLKQSVQKNFKTLDPETKIYPGHGDSSTVQQEMLIHNF